MTYSPTENDTSFNDSLFGITVNTWGTEADGKQGLTHNLEIRASGGNVGHASINMKLPINETTKQWIEQYCCEETYEHYKRYKDMDATYATYLENVPKRIPVNQKKITVRKANRDESGQLKTSQELAYEQEYFDIDFSWWPKRPDSKLPGILSTYSNDTFNELHGVPFNYDERWKEYLKPEQRRHKGKMGGTLMDYGPNEMVHQRDLPHCLVQRIEKRLHREHILNQIETIKLLHGKIDNLKNSKHKSAHDSVFLMFHNLGFDYNGMLDDYLKDCPEKPVDVEKLKRRFRLRIDKFLPVILQ